MENDRSAVQSSVRPVVFVTGANGFVGVNLCRGLTALNYRVVGMVRPDSDLRMLDGVRIELVRGDLRRPGSLRPPRDTQYVVHSAATVSDSASDTECRAGILAATRHLAEAALEQCPQLRRFVYISSALVLGYGRTGIAESRPGRSCTYLPYVKYKQQAESLLLSLYRSRGLPVVILRPSDVYGRFDRTSVLRMCRAIDRGVPILVGTGASKLAYCHVETLVRAVARVCEFEGAVGKCYTVASDTPVTWREFFGHLSKGLGRPLRGPMPAALVFAAVVVIELARRLVPLRNPDLTQYRFRRATQDTTYDTSATVRELGLAPDEDIAGQLLAAARWYREHRTGRPL